jgi:hypothetical protein
MPAMYQNPFAEGPRLLCSPGEFIRWAFLPYGGGMNPDDGQDILFNRWYQAIWRRTPGGVVAPAEGDRYNHVDQYWVYNDGHSEREKRVRAKAKLVEWGLPAEFPLSVAKRYALGS